MNWEEIEKGIDEKNNNGIKKKPEDIKTKSKLTELVSEIFDNVSPKDVPVHDPTDLKNVFDMWQKLQAADNDGINNGKLPPLSTGKENIIENAVHVTYHPVHQEDGSYKQEKTISVDDIANMTSDEIAKLITGKENLQNNENVDNMM